RIGGDLYAVQETPFGLRAIVGDVVGKGMRAVPAVSAVLGAFREAAESAPDLGVLAQRLNHALERDCHADEEGAECCTTALLAEFPPGGGTVTLLS
ncbi:SpoIIE family protein phosphatase, partial [Streptomyces sp. NRRL S-1824]|uniref:SpoIIE family protein phosphatase n=1 Tax=Streptomyces sp. NRRL S-1824 TaxID=1463889 RepID=UPI0004C77A78